MAFLALVLFTLVALLDMGVSAAASGYVNLVAALAIVAFVVRLIQGRNL